MFRPVTIRAVIAIALVTGVFAGCKRESTGTDAITLSEPFFIRGPIAQVGAPWGNLVTGEPGTSYRVDRAYFRVSDETEMRFADGRAATTADLKVGRTITLWITGPIMESYPVQVSALRIVID